MKIKKLYAVCLAALIGTVSLCSFICESDFGNTVYAAETIIGDANGDGKVSALDAAFIARKLAEQNGSEIPSNAEYNGDGKITAADASAIAFRLANNLNVEEIVKIVNEERAKVGADPVTLDEGMTAAAMVRAKEISSYFSHTRTDGTSCFTVFSNFGISYSAAGENIAAGNYSAEATMNQWINSEGHYANIISTDYSKIGVGYVYVPNSTYKYYWVQLFKN